MTSEQILHNVLSEINWDYGELQESNPELIEKAKKYIKKGIIFHVTAALEAASKEDLNCECDSWERCHNKMPVNDILNSYPLTKII